MVLDTTGYDLGPLLQHYSEISNVPILGCTAAIIAESGLDPFASRYGAWPDVSFGLGQQTVKYAADYGIGDGSNTPGNIAVVRSALLNRETAIRVMCQHLQSDYAKSTTAGDTSVLGGLVTYNCGHYPEPGDSYWSEYSANVASYRIAISKAEALLQ